MTSDFPNIVPSDSRSDVIESQALAWLAQMDGGNMTAEDMKAFREWISRSPAHAQEIRELSSFWGELNVLTDMIEPIAIADLPSSRLRKRLSSPIKTFGFAAPVLALALFGVLFFQTISPTTPDTNSSINIASVAIPLVYKTEIGEQESHVLSDGSTLTLNTNSHVEIDFKDDSRRIRLLQGEALFDVAHDTRRPFLVFAGEGLVRAVGTSFTVRLNDADNLIDVIVSEGSVELSSVIPSETSLPESDRKPKLSSIGIIKAGYSASFRDTEASIKSITEQKIIEKLSWKEGMLTFSGETLDEVIKEVSRYTELDIVFQDSELQDLKIGGVYPANDTETLLFTLKENFGVNADVSTPGVVLLSVAQ